MLSPRKATSPLRKIFRKSPKLTLAAAGATIAMTAVLASAVATVGSAGAQASASTLSASRTGASASMPARGLSASLMSGDGGRQASPVGRASLAGPGDLAATRLHAGAGHASTGHVGVSLTAHRGVAVVAAHPAAPHASRPPAHTRHACPSGPAVRRWICQADRVLVAHGMPRAAVNPAAAAIVVMHESGGNPAASNGWDSNAAAGTPSEGIAQVIAPTFAAYHLPGHDNIWNPVDNMIAAFRYAVARYGSMNNIPGVVAVRSGGSYVGY